MQDGNEPAQLDFMEPEQLTEKRKTAKAPQEKSVKEGQKRQRGEKKNTSSQQSQEVTEKPTAEKIRKSNSKVSVSEALPDANNDN